MKPLLFLIFFVFETIPCVSQTNLSIKGKILDQKTNEALPYANISIKNYSIGTVSNESGEFDFFVPADLINDTLVVSFIGYKIFKETISNLTESKIIYLEELPILLSEVTVSSEGARKLVEEALKAVPLVYPSEPYLMEGFHRSWEKLNFTDSISYPGTLIEAAVTIYDPGYGQKKVGKAKEEIYINEIRRSAVMDGWNYGPGNALKDLLDKNLVKYPNALAFISLKSFLNFPNNMIYEWEGTAKIDDENLSIIKIEIPNAQKFPAFYKVYISEGDHAILRFELYGVKREIDYSIGEWHIENLSQVYIFKRYQSKPYLNYVKLKYTVKNLDQKKKKVLRSEDYYRELLINNIITANVEEQRKGLAAKKSKEVSLALQVKNYNAEFWKNYNVIKESPLDKEIIQYFEQKSRPEKSPKKGKR
ncbi:MAG: carboxypeptidase-like regulatory domain-containing protein [Cyclobacteriaceae bacterium]